MPTIPLEIINHILCYLKDDIVYLQYEITDNYEYKEAYKINMCSNLLWNIRSTLVMKKTYPLTIPPNFSQSNKELYKYGKAHYEKLLRNNIKI